MRKYTYRQYKGGLREYESEDRWQAAAAYATQLDDLIRRNAAPERITAVLHTAQPFLASTFARMIHLVRLFYADTFCRFDKATQYLLLGNGACAPKTCQRLMKRKDEMSPNAISELINNLCSRDVDRTRGAREFLLLNRWLMARMLQEEVYMACDDDTRKFLLECARIGSSSDKRLFVAQIMNSDGVPQTVKTEVYCALKPYDEQFIREMHEDVLVHTKLLGHDAHVNGAHLGLTKEYSCNENRPDYHMAVCEQVQRAYAECGYFRYQWSRSKLPGYKIIRSSFPRFASMKDKWSSTSTKGLLDEVTLNDNPGCFKLMCDLNGVHVGLTQIVYLMRYRKVESLRFLVRECREELEEAISLTELLFFVSAYGDWDNGIIIAEEIERMEPGTIASAVDHFGNTPMWYTLYALNTTNPQLTWAVSEKARVAFVRMLHASGCDPYRKNHLGISYADVKGYEP